MVHMYELDKHLKIILKKETHSVFFESLLNLLHPISFPAKFLLGFTETLIFPDRKNVNCLEEESTVQQSRKPHSSSQQVLQSSLSALIYFWFCEVP